MWFSVPLLALGGLVTVAGLPPTAFDAQCGSRKLWCQSGDPSHGATFSCINPRIELKNCGGCAIVPDGTHATDGPTAPIGRNCLQIPGIEEAHMRCVSGVCKVSKCQPGWMVSRDRTSCTEMFDEGD